MAFGLNKLSRYLTKRHDSKLREQSATLSDGKLSAAEKVPSPMLAFNAIENKTDERYIIDLLRGIFSKNEIVKQQYGRAGENLLYCACKLGRLKVAKFLMDNDLNPQKVTSLGTVLHALLEAYVKRRISFDDFVTATKDVCARGCDVGAVNHKEMSPFLCAMESADIDVMKTYVDLGCDYNAKDASGDHTLHIACRLASTRVHTIKYLLSLQQISVQIFNTKGLSPLYIVVKEYLDCSKKWPVSGEASYDTWMKLRMQLLAVVEALLKTGADPRRVSAEHDAKYLCNLLLVQRLAEVAHMRTVLNEHPQRPPRLSQQSTTLHDSERSDATWHMLPLTNQLLCTTMLYGGIQDFSIDPFRRWCVRNHVAYEDSIQHQMYYEGSGFYEDPYVDNVITFEHEMRSELYARPMRLNTLCRSTIRIELAMHANLDSVDQLPLPKKIVDYIGLKTIM